MPKILILKFITIILFVYVSTYTQNARLDALGNNFLIDDFSSVCGTPSSLIQYHDAIQATVYQDGSFGPALGAKSLGKRFTIGFSANEISYFDSTFYNNALLFLDSAIDTTNALPDKFPPYPHLLLAMSLSNINIGCEVFYQRAKLESTIKSNYGYEETVKKDVMISGLQLSTAFHIYQLGIYPHIRYCIPKAQGTLTTKDTSTETVSLSTINNSIIETGIEIDFNFNTVNYRFGGGYSVEQYTFTNSADLKDQPKNKNTFLSIYGGLNIWPIDKVQLSAAYSFCYGTYYSDGNFREWYSNTKQIEKNHFVVGSCEYHIPLSLIVDQIIIRSGLVWSSTITTYTSHSDSTNTTIEATGNRPVNVTNCIPTVGLGITKGIMQFDIASKLAGWSGLVAGMPVITGTLTFDFIKNRDAE